MFCNVEIVSEYKILKPFVYTNRGVSKKVNMLVT